MRENSLDIRPLAGAIGAETGRKALYVNGGHTVRFKDMPEQESAPLLQFCSRIWRGLNSPAASAGGKHRWRCGTIAAPSTTRSTIITAFAASCTASR